MQIMAAFTFLPVLNVIKQETPERFSVRLELYNPSISAPVLALKMVLRCLRDDGPHRDICWFVGICKNRNINYSMQETKAFWIMEQAA